MALTPSATNPNRKEQLTKMKKLSETSNGRDLLKKDFNLELTDSEKIVIKDVVTPKPAISEDELKDPARQGRATEKKDNAETKKI